MANVCDLCHQRPATTRVTRVMGNRKTTESLCDVCSSQRSRFGRMGLGTSLFDQFFSDFGDEDFGGCRVHFNSRWSATTSQRPSLMRRGAYWKRPSSRREAGAASIDTEHLLVALAKDPLGRTALSRMKLDPARVAERAESEMRRGKRPMERPELSPHAKRALELAYQEAYELGHSYVGPEHVLLGLLHEGEGLASEILREQGLSTARRARPSRKRWHLHPRLAGRPRPRWTSTAAT